MAVPHTLGGGLEAGFEDACVTGLTGNSYQYNDKTSIF